MRRPCQTLVGPSSQAVADELIPANPCAIKGAGQRDARDRVERRTVSLQEMWALADGMPERYRASVILAFCSGLRAGELFALQRKHVDLAAGVVRVEQSLAPPGTGQGWFSAPKTRAGKRAVVLPAIAVTALREHMTRFTPPGRDSLLFGTRTGTPLSSGQRTTMFAKARTAIARDDLTWHDQRHSALTLVASTGATLSELMQRAGHASPRAALHYQHAVDDSQRRIVERPDQVLSERPRTALVGRGAGASERLRAAVDSNTALADRGTAARKREGASVVARPAPR